MTDTLNKFPYRQFLCNTAQNMGVFELEYLLYEKAIIYRASLGSSECYLEEHELQRLIGPLDTNTGQQSGTALAV